MQLHVILSVLLGAVWMKLTEGCSCQPTHPHIQYCRSDYVIRGKVMYKETMYPNRVETTTVTPSTEASHPSIELAPWLTEPLSAVRVGPPGLLELSPFSDLADPNNPTKIVYTVYVEKIYKGENFISPKQLVKITTPPSDGLCGVTHLTSRYILSGKVENGELSIKVCDYIARYDQVTRRQKQGLKYHWKKTCGDCSVGVCFGQYCPSHVITNTCMLDIAPSLYHCEIDLARCTRNKRSDCVWYGKKDYRECQRERVHSNSRSLPFQP